MDNMRLHSVCVALALAAVLGCNAVAQQPNAASVLSGIQSRDPVTRGRAYSDGFALLSGERQASKADVLHLADSLKQLVLKSEDADVRDYAVSLLKRSGARETARFGVFGEHLKAIYEESDDPGIKTVALDGLGKLHDRERWISYLSGVASGNARFHDAAAVAIYALAAMDKAAARTALKALRDRKTVTDRDAKQLLDRIAANNWAAPK
jgi:hypothetical protein